jgi:hypothetical protein
MLALAAATGLAVPAGADTSDRCGPIVALAADIMVWRQEGRDFAALFGPGTGTPDWIHGIAVHAWDHELHLTAPMQARQVEEFRALYVDICAEVEARRRGAP